MEVIRWSWEIPDDSGAVTVSLIATDGPGFAEVDASTVVGDIALSQRIVVTFLSSGAPLMGTIELTTIAMDQPADGVSSTGIRSQVFWMFWVIRYPKGNIWCVSKLIWDFLPRNGGDSQVFTVATPDIGDVTVSLMAPTTPGTAHIVVTSGGVTQTARNYLCGTMIILFGFFSCRYQFVCPA